MATGVGKFSTTSVDEPTPAPTPTPLPPGVTGCLATSNPLRVRCTASLDEPDLATLVLRGPDGTERTFGSEEEPRAQIF